MEQLFLLYFPIIVAVSWLGVEIISDLKRHLDDKDKIEKVKQEVKAEYQKIYENTFKPNS